MSEREVLIILAHAQMCMRCREGFLNNAAEVFRGRALTDEEKECLSRLTAVDFTTAERLSKASGYALDELTQYFEHPVARLRHF